MRKISKDAAQSFQLCRGFKRDNTEVIAYTTGIVQLRLWGNLIAEQKAWLSSTLRISTCGWRTRTTFDRLNALPNVHVYTKGGKLFLNGREWDGKGVDVYEFNNNAQVVSDDDSCGIFKESV